MSLDNLYNTGSLHKEAPNHDEPLLSNLIENTVEIAQALGYKLSFQPES